VNNHLYKVSVKDKYDELLHEMGFDSGSAKKGGDVKAPMPGLVLNVMVKVGQKIKQGDSLLVLEAMKMENILKANADGEVKKVIVKKGDKVEKSQVMLSLG
jgi:biotin carboxyl carrier protein